MSDFLLSDQDNTRLAIELMERHHNEDYGLAEYRNRELTALAVGVDFVTRTFGRIPPATLKESIVTAYLMGRADGRDEQA